MVRNCAPTANMETTLYEEHSFHNRLGSEINQMKRSNLTLDFSQARPQVKRMKLNASVVTSAQPVLSSPDLNMLKLGSPELEKLIIGQNGLITATPTPTTTSILFPPTVTEEQKQYALGFEEALNDLHNGDSSQGGGMQQVELPASSSGSSSGGTVYTNLDQQQQHHPSSHNSFSMSHFGHLDNGIVIKDEPQTVPSLGNTPPLSPIDMESQERIKLERKRQRNRLAASKCRRRKLERISRLEDKVKMLKGENSELTSVVNKLKEHVCKLKEQVMEHVQAGCQMVISSVGPHF